MRIWTRRLLGLEDPPRRIAMGAALGMVIAFGPTWGMQIVLAIGLAALLRVNKAATLLPTFIVNPVTGPVVFFLQYLLGRTLLFTRHSEGEVRKVRELAEALGNIRLSALWSSIGDAFARAGGLGWGLLLPTLVGMFVSAAVLAAITYPLTYRGVVWFRRKRHERRERREARRVASDASDGSDASDRSAEPRSPPPPEPAPARKP
jgi:uncharacterized protein (DUF2062 family)